MLKALTRYLAELLDETAQNVPGGLELGYIKVALSDLSSDITGTIQQAAEDMAGRFA